MSQRRFLIPLALLLGAAATALSCRDPSPVGLDAGPPARLASDPTSPARGWGDGDESDDEGDGDDGVEADSLENEDGGSLLSCRPLPYESVTQTIGQAGGVIEVRNNWLIVPRGALREPVQITAVAPSDTVAMVRFQPAGLRFQTPAVLVETYDNCRVPKGVTPRIALVTNAFQVVEFLTPVDAPLGDPRFKKARRGRHVIGELHHFSNYAVAW